MNITIVGAGPIGCYAGYLLAKKGHNVEIFEKKKNIGEPIQCTGLLTEPVTELIDIKDEFLTNTTTKVKIHAPNGKTATIHSKEYIIDRFEFDLHMAEKAQSAGAKIHVEHSLKDYTNHHLIFKNTRHNTLKKQRAHIIIGADGPLSKTAEIFKFKGKRGFFYGVQEVVETRCDQDAYNAYFGKEFPGFFGWLVPETENRARLGIAAMKNAPRVYQNFKKKFRIKKTISKQAGLIPIYNPNLQIQKKNIYLVGDAALQTKATTGGGLISGFKGAQALVYSIENKQSYQDEVQHGIGKELKMHLRIRKLLDKFSDEDYNYLVRLTAGQAVKKVLAKESRETPRRLLMKLLLAEPRFLKFGMKVL